MNKRYFFKIIIYSVLILIVGIYSVYYRGFKENFKLIFTKSNEIDNGNYNYKDTIDNELSFLGVNNNSSKEKDLTIPVLMYHHLTYDSSKWNDCTISPLKFKEDMLYLKILGYTPIHFKDYIAYKEEGKELPDNPILITLDDGYLSNYQYAYPILKELNMKATISMIGWSVGRKYHKDGVTPINEHFTWEQAREMYNSGLIDIQHHTYDLHNIGDNVTCGLGVSKLPNETEEEYRKRFIEDVLKLKKLIEENIGNKVIVFTYPYGIYNETTEQILKNLGFKITLTIEHGISDFSKSSFLIKRINMPSNIPSFDLMKEILKLDDRNIKIPFEDIKEQNERIKKLEELYKNNVLAKSR